MIFPPKNQALLLEYKILQDQACINWEELTTGRKRAPPTKFSVSNVKDDPRGTLYNGARKLSMGGTELKQQQVIKIQKKIENPAVMFKNTFANEMRSLA